jgi:CBS domain containing-hemolysin-like protein
MRLFAILLSPVVWLGSAVSNGMLRLSGSDVNAATPFMTEEELRLMVNVGEEEGIIEESEKDMIHGIFELEETTAREVMVPRIDVFALEANVTVAEAIDAIIRESYSRVPIYQGTIDNIIGILYARDLFKMVRDGEWSREVKDIVRPAHYIPETKHVDELLRELRQTHVHIAIVVDEYGGTAGMVTIEDLIEEIVGEIQDEFDVEEAKIEQMSNTEAIFDATVSLDDVNQTLMVNLESDEDSIGGFIYDKLGKIPLPGDHLQIDGVEVEVLSTERRRIKKVKVTVQGPMAEAAGAE